MSNRKHFINLTIVLLFFILGGIVHAQEKLFNEIDQIIYLSKKESSAELNQKIYSHVSQINKILEVKNGLSIIKSNKIISTLDDQIAFYAGNDDMVKYLKSAKKVEQYNLDDFSKNAKAIKAISALGTTLNIYDLVKTTNKAYENIQKGNANLQNSYLPVAEKIASFNPVAGGLIHIKNEIDTSLNLSRDIGNEYYESITKIRDRYYRQYNILANKGIKGQDPEGMMNLFKKQREEMRNQLDGILKDLNEGTLAALPVFGKQKARDELIKIRYDILGADKEKAIEEKQSNFYNKMYSHFEIKQSSQKLENSLSKLDSTRSSHLTNLLTDLEKNNQTNITIPIGGEPKSPPSANKDKTQKNPPSSLSLENKKAKAEQIRKQNIKLALKYEALLKENKGKTPEAIAIKKELNATGTAYSSFRAEILKADPDYEKQLRANSTYYYATSQTVTKKVGEISEVATVVTAILNPTQDEFDAKAKEQLAIASDIATTSKSLDSLTADLNSKMATLHRLEQQNNNYSESNQGDVSKAEVNNAFNDFQSFLGAHRDIKRIVAKYNGDIDAISGGDKVQLKILARNFLGHAGKWSELASNSFEMMGNKAIKYRDLKKRYENNPQPKTSPNSSQIAKLKREIEQLERRIAPKAREMEELLFEFNQSKQELAVLINENNDDNKVIEALYKAEEIEKSWFGKYSVVGSSPTDYTYHWSSLDGFWDSELKQGGPALELQPDGLSKPITITPDYGSYNYVAWGRWAGGNTVAIRDDGAVFDDVDGHWIFGQETLDMPKQGSAQYNGTVMGGYVNHGNGTVEPDSIRGTVAFTVGFNNGVTSLNGQMNLTRNGANWATATFNEADARAGAAQDFEASLTVVGGGQGYIDGTFYGPNAVEAAGGFYVDKQSGDMGGASGVFRAKKQ